MMYFIDFLKHHLHTVMRDIGDIEIYICTPYVFLSPKDKHIASCLSKGAATTRTHAKHTNKASGLYEGYDKDMNIYEKLT